ncbi:MAG: glycoside hydrolase family 2, partial [Candidatus Hydrogenedentes bacterium]|nr:glycoside hydrolase family 2 [Candidatus Hydrogenedentota bacterium]
MFRLAFLLALLFVPLWGADAVADDMPRPEHPRPDQVRSFWLNLNGTWDFEFDDEDRGLAEEWFHGTHAYQDKILVPFAYQSKRSGIGTNDPHPIVWYHRSFDIPENFVGKRVLLHFGAVDYEARVYLNGRQMGLHKGGHVSFSFDVTGHLSPTGNELVLRVEDTESKLQPRGKQYWEEIPEDIWYTRTTGIWQTVWLEAVGQTWIRDFKVTPRVASSSIDVEVDIADQDAAWQMELLSRNRATGEEASRTFPAGIDRLSLVVGNTLSLWSPENPNLYDLVLRLKRAEGGEVLDRVDSYFGMRSVSVLGNQFYLNGEPYYQKLILDQGYWPETVLTAPSDAALKYDVEMTKKFGFNGARKHQKVEDPRWLYWADTLGLLVWGEMPSQHGAYVREMEGPFLSEWQAALRRDYNHPSIVTWVPFNETWGIEGTHIDPRVQRWVERVYHATKAIDPHRPVCDNSGWDHVLTDIADYHDYAGNGAQLQRRFQMTKAGHYARLQEGRFMFFAEGRSY